MKNWLTNIIALLLPSCLSAELYYLGPSSVEYLTPVPITGISTPNTLLMVPAIYGFNGPNYDCTNEGLYRYYVVNANYAQRIVYNGNLDKLMTALTWVHAHGYQDDSLTYSSALAASTTRKLLMSCGSITRFVSAVLDSQNITNRQVLLLTLDTWNTYNNGHTVLEISRNGVWEIWDVDNRTRVSVLGNYLNALEFCNSSQNGNYIIDYFSLAPKFAYSDLSTGGFDYTFWYEGDCLTEPSLRTFYKRNAQLALIYSSGYWWFTTTDSNIRTRVEGYSADYKYMAPSTWMSTFYP